MHISCLLDILHNNSTILLLLDHTPHNADHNVIKHMEQDAYIKMILGIILGVGVMLDILYCQAPPRPPNNSSQAADASAATNTQRLQTAGSIFSHAGESCSGTNLDCNECAICLKKFKNGEVCRLLVSCKHTFHRSCIDEWLSKASHCPLCRAQV